MEKETIVHFPQRQETRHIAPKEDDPYERDSNVNNAGMNNECVIKWTKYELLMSNKNKLWIDD